ncbi:hypothetical protein LAZ67_7000116 [Cordylochernes scorpioides]|uniref:protein-serine/threonine phosphatase n=1 Tax=Cordylochernes scorpioides TaxID=51811 RepID=A0ABY6KLD5_9ARAC|nr:hypothetical protein LAZ67_7000116 [Cordylochernes scorpioides]
MEGILVAPVTKKKTQVLRTEAFEAGLCSMQGWRTSQEDAHSCLGPLDLRGTALFGVYDGHGGGEVARYCSRHLPDILRAQPDFLHGDLSSAIQQAFLQLDRTLTDDKAIEELWKLAVDPECDTSSSSEDEEEVIFSDDHNIKVVFEDNFHQEYIMEDDDDLVEFLQEEEADLGYEDQTDDDDCSEEYTEEVKQPGYTSGTTALVCLLREKELYVANLGDSRCILSRKNTLIPLTRDHKPHEITERMRIERAGGEVTRDGRIDGDLNLSRALGDHRFKNNPAIQQEDQILSALPDVKVSTVSSGDVVIMACDGIWDVLTEHQVASFVRKRLKKKESLTKICELLIHQCLATDQDAIYGVDNMTCIIIKIL